MSVMVVKVLLKAWSPVTGPGAAGEEVNEKDGGTRRTSAWCHMCHTSICIFVQST